jgi:Leucine Rich repeat
MAAGGGDADARGKEVGEGEEERFPSLEALCRENLAAYLALHAREDASWERRGAEVLASFAREEAFAGVAAGILRSISLLRGVTPALALGAAQRHLRRLELPEAGDVRGWPWVRILEGCPKLEVLRLETAQGLSEAESELPRALLLVHNLEELYLAHSDADNDVVQCAIGGSGRTLRVLDLSWCELVTDSPFATSSAPDTPVLGGLALSRNLEVLMVGATCVSDRTVSAALTHCARLHTLSLHMSKHVAKLPLASDADEGISTASLRALRSLRHVDFTGLHSVSAARIDLFLTSTCRGGGEGVGGGVCGELLLQRLSHPVMFAEVLPGLRSLRVAESELPGTTLRRWAAKAARKRPKATTDVREWDVREWDGEEDGSGREMLGVGEGPLHMPGTETSGGGAWGEGELGLEALDFSWCDEVKEGDVAALVSVCPGLTSLDVQCVALTDVLLTALAARCPQLTRLNAARCDGITDVGVRALARGCSKLRDVNLAWSMGITNVGVAELLLHGRSLRRVVLEGCKALEADDALLRAADNAAARFDLHTVDLRWVNAIDADVARALALRLPFATVVDYYEAPHTHKRKPH